MTTKQRRGPDFREKMINRHVKITTDRLLRKDLNAQQAQHEIKLYKERAANWEPGQPWFHEVDED